MRIYFSLALWLLSIGCISQETQNHQAKPLDSQEVQGSIKLGKDFGAIWGDGNAELSSYRLRIKRYGEIREGIAVSIFVREIFSEKERVKAETNQRSKAGQFPVMKLNLIEDFQTGIYDYNIMQSSFVSLIPNNQRPAGTPTKTSFSSQEWCGHVYHQLLFYPDSIQEQIHSYFEGEADSNRNLEYPKDGLSEDFLLLWARGMAFPLLKPGETRTHPLLLALKTARFSHTSLTWTPATLSRSSESETLTIPAGEFQVETLSVKTANEEYTFWVEKDLPRRVVRWEKNTGEFAEMLATERLPYWKLQQQGMESYLKKLRLSSSVMKSSCDKENCE